MLHTRRYLAASLTMLAAVPAPLLSDRQLAASLTVRGSASRITPFFQKLQRGEPVKVGVVGTSVAMSGGCQREHQPYLRCADFDGTPGRMRWAYNQVARTPTGVRGWALRALDYLNSSWPHAAHQIHNAGVDGYTASAQERCLIGSLPLDVDVVLVAYGGVVSGRTNDLEAVERILRQLLSYPQAPQLLLVTVREWCRCRPPARSRPVNGSYECKQKDGTSGYQLFRAWDHGQEDSFNALCTRYGLACVSMREGVYREVMAGEAGYTIPDVAGDCMHPSRSHRGHRYLGDMVVHALKQLQQHTPLREDNVPRVGSADQGRLGGFASVRRRHVANVVSARLGHEATPDGAASNSWRCFQLRPSSGTRATIGEIRQTSGFEAESLFGNGTFVPDARCRALRACVLSRPASAAPAPCVHVRGHWQYCVHAIQVGGAPRKPGVVAFAPGAVMRVAVNAAPVTTAAARSCAAGRKTEQVVSLNYLVGYEQMGTAIVSCEGGCRCDQQRLDAHVPPAAGERGVTIAQEVTFPIELTPCPGGGGAACQLRFEVDRQTSSMGYKWKLLDIAVGEIVESVVA